MVAYRRKVRLEYYAVKYRKNDDAPDVPDRPFDFELWIQKAAKVSIQDRIFDYYEEKARLDRLMFDDRSRLWCMSFVRLRETNIPAKGRLNRESEPVELEDDEFISEDAAALYDPNLKVVMLQRNRHSLGPSGIEKYLNHIWGEDGAELYLRPLPPQDVRQKATTAPIYRRITIRFADISETDTAFRGPLARFISTFGEYGAITAEVTVSMSNTKKTSLNPETVRDTINEVYRSPKRIRKASVGLKVDEDSTVEDVDLFDDKVHTHIWFTMERRQSMISEFLFDQMKAEHVECIPMVLASLGGSARDDTSKAG